MQAKALAKDATDGGTLRQSAQHLPLVLMSEKGSSTDDVWRGIEVGAADVLEKPLSLLKLRNIWQHVVRKVRFGSPCSIPKAPFLFPPWHSGIWQSMMRVSFDYPVARCRDVSPSHRPVSLWTQQA